MLCQDSIYTRLKRFFDSYFGADNVRFEGKFTYIYDLYKFENELSLDSIIHGEIILNDVYVDKNNNPDQKTVYVIFGSAEIDKRPIEVMAASSRDQECVTDSVFWRQRSENTSAPLNDLIMPIIECVK